MIISWRVSSPTYFSRCTIQINCRICGISFVSCILGIEFLLTLPETNISWRACTTCIRVFAALACRYYVVQANKCELGRIRSSCSFIEATEEALSVIRNLCVNTKRIGLFRVSQEVTIISLFEISKFLPVLFLHCYDISETRQILYLTFKHSSHFSFSIFRVMQFIIHIMF